jgi:6-phospho-beta-glucosidase
VARNVERLEAIARAIDMVGKGEFNIERSDCSRIGLACALDRADVVVIQVRYGGLEGREFDESFPCEFGACGDEGLGPGGLSAAWRAWPHLNGLLEQIQQSCPVAKVLLLTSPAGILTRLANFCWPNLQVKAFCELPWTTLQNFNHQQAEASYDYLGINHLGWIYNLAGRDPFPLKYWRLDTERDQVIREQRCRNKSRAAELKLLTESALRAYASGSIAEINAAIDSRCAPWYSHALAPLLESMISHQSNIHFFFSEPNMGWNQSFADNDVLEIPSYWDHGQLIRRPARSVPPGNLVKTLTPFVVYERIATRAVLVREKLALEDALEHHPWVTNRANARGLASAIVAGHLECEVLQ